MGILIVTLLDFRQHLIIICGRVFRNKLAESSSGSFLRGSGQEYFNWA